MFSRLGFGARYAMAFVDVRMRPLDGVETTARIWELIRCPSCHLHRLLDCSWTKCLKNWAFDRLVILKKPLIPSKSQLPTAFPENGTCSRNPRTSGGLEETVMLRTAQMAGAGKIKIFSKIRGRHLPNLREAGSRANPLWRIYGYASPKRCWNK